VQKQYDSFTLQRLILCLQQLVLWLQRFIFDRHHVRNAISAKSQSLPQTPEVLRMHDGAWEPAHKGDENPWSSRRHAAARQVQPSSKPFVGARNLRVHCLAELAVI
jgi:hypothetical protein